MATDHNFRIKNGLEVGGVLIVNSSGQLVVADVSSNIKLNDNVQLQFGTGTDSNIRHDGNNTKFTHTGSGGLYIGADTFGIQNGAHNENYIMAAANGAVTVYYDGSLRLSTTSSGIKVEGPHGNATIGAQNTSGFHIYTDRSRFYFNKQISLIDNTLTSYDNDLVLKRVGSTKLTLTSTGVSVGGDLSVSGDLNITGDINSVSVTDLDVVDKTITVGQGQSASNSTGSGLKVHGSNASMLWDNTDDRWEFNKDIHTSGGLEFGDGVNRIYKSGDSNSMHFDVPTALIGPSTTTSSNPSIGTSAYRFDGLWSSTGNFSGDVTVGGDIYAKDSDSNTDPTIAFVGHTDSGLSMSVSGSNDQLSVITDGVRRGYFNNAGITSTSNVYTSGGGSFRNYGASWTASTGLTGNGFSFINTVDGTALTLSSTGNAVFAGTISSGAITSTGASSGRYTGLEVVNSTNAGGTETAIGLGVVAAGNSACDVKLVANRVGANSGSDFYIEQTDSSGSQQETFRITETGNATFAGAITAGATISSGAITSTGNLLLDVDNAEINLKSGIGTTSGAINWTFNTTGTDYASIKLPYATRASTGLHIDSGYPITIDSASGTGIKFDVLGGNRATITNTGLSVSGTGSFTSNVSVATSGGSFTVGGDLGAEYWTRAYDVSNTNIGELLNQDGTSLETGGAYRFTAHIDGTGTDQSSRAVFWNENGTWNVNVTGQSGTSSNHILFLVDSGVPSVKTYHANNYTVRVWHERINLNENNGTDNSEHYFGADAYLSKINNDLSVNANILKIGATGTAPASAKLHIGAINSTGSSAIAQFGGFIRASNYLILHDGAGSTNTVQMRNTSGDVDLTQGEGASATPATRVHTLKISGTTVIDNSRNLSNIGTISSGAITSSGAIVGSTVQATGNLFGTNGLHTLNTAGNGWDHTINRNGGNPTANLPGGITSGSITSTGNSVFTGGNSDGTGNAFEVKRGGNSQQQALRIQNTGEVVISNNYLYAAHGGTSFYSQGDAVFRATIRNDSNGGADPVKVSDALNVTGNIQSNGTVILQSSGRNLTNIGTISSGAATLTSGSRVLTLLTSSQAVTDNNAGFTIREKDTYSDGRYEHRFRKRDEGGGIPLYIDKTESTAGAHTQIARFGSYSSNPEEFQVYGKAKVNDLHIHSGTGGTNTQGLLFTLTDNADTQAYIKKTAYYMHYNAHYNEGHRFTVNGTDDILRMHGSNNGTRPDSVDILASNGLYVNNTQVINSSRTITAENVLNVNSPDGGSSPAMTATINLKGYEGRGAGIKIRDSVNSASSPNNREWFIGSGYAQSGFNIGYAADGSQSSYTAQNKFSISTAGHASFAGNITAAGTLTATDLTLSGNLIVNGTTTTLNTATLNVEDKNIILNYGSGDTSGSADYAGITIQDAVNSSTNATINWHQSGSFFNFSHNVNTDGYLQHVSYLYSRDDLRVLNATNNGWHTWANRNNGTFDLSVGAITTNNSILISYSGNDGAGRDAGLKIMNDSSDWGAYIRKASGAAYGLRIDSANDHALSIYSAEGGSTRSFYVHGGTGLVSTSSHGTSANWKQAYDNYITGIGVTGTSTKTITLTQRDGGTISANFTDLQGSAADGVVDSLSFDAGTVAGGTSGTGVLTLGRSGSLSDLTVDLDGRYLQRQYMNNWTRVGYGDGGTTKWHKLCTITINGAYKDYTAAFYWTDRYDRGEASIHVHSDNDSTADVWGARFVSTTDSNRKVASDVMYTKSGSTVEIFVRTPSWREFDYIRNDAVSEGTPNITWYDESTTTEYTSQPSNVTAFTDMTPISQNGYNNSFNGNLADKDNSQYYLNPAETSVINQLDVATNIRHNGDTDTKIAFTTNEQDFVVGGVTGLHMDSSRLNINPNAGNYDFRVSGDNETNLIYADASTDRVGIGTATPSYDLDIVGASAGLRVSKTANDARIITASSTAGAWLEMQSPNYYTGLLHLIGGTEQWALGPLQGQSQYTLRRGRSGAIVLTALTDGKVGINNNTPLRRFVVTDVASDPSDNSGIAAFTAGTGANTDAKMQFGIKSNHCGWIHVVKPGNNVFPLLLNPTGSSNGKVGIGSGLNPGAMLDIAQNMTNASTSAFTSPHLKLTAQNTVDTTGFVGMTFATSSSANYGWSYGAIRHTSGTGDIAWRFHNNSASGNEMMRLKEDGKLGIGTDSPGARLDVEAGALGGTTGNTTTAAIFRAGRQNLIFQDTRTATGTDWKDATFKMIAQIDSTNHQSIDFVNDSSYNEHIDIRTGNQVFNTRFTHNGRVGIGTTNPQYKLHVPDTIGARILKLGHGVSYARISTDDATKPLDFQINSVNKIRIATDGQLLINKTGSDVGASVNIVEADGNFRLQGGNRTIKFNNGSHEIVGIAQIASNKMQYASGKMTIDVGNSRVGIGTTDPQHKLDAVGTIRHTSNIVSNTVYKAFSIGSNRTINDYGGLNKDYWAIQLATPGASTDGQSSGHAYGALKFSGVSGSDTTLDDVLVLNYNGNVGIGTNNPGKKLEVAGVGNTDGIRITGGSANVSQIINNTGTGGVAWDISSSGAGHGHGNGKLLFNVGFSGTPWLALAPGRKVGIGTHSPTVDLDVKNSSGATIMVDDNSGRFIKIRSGNNGSQNANISSYSGLYLGGSDNASHMIITNSGNVGIGTNNPGEKLDVNGPITLTDKIIHKGDTDTYTSFPAADEWNLYCGGARMIKAVETASNHNYISFFDGTSLSGAIYFDAAGNGHFDANVTAYSTTTGSDKRLKENIRPLENSLDKVLSLDGVMFDWKKESRGKDQIGFIAQQVEEHVPELVGSMNDIDIGEAKTVNYEGVVPMLVEAIKDLKAEIDDLKEQLKNK